MNFEFKQKLTLNFYDMQTNRLVSDFPVQRFMSSHTFPPLVTNAVLVIDIACIRFFCFDDSGYIIAGFASTF